MLNQNKYQTKKKKKKVTQRILFYFLFQPTKLFIKKTFIYLYLIEYLND